MLNDQKILEELNKMPPPLKAELLHYMAYLMDKYTQISSLPKRPQFGSAKGFYKTAEDFDSPLEDTDLGALPPPSLTLSWESLQVIAQN